MKRISRSKKDTAKIAKIFLEDLVKKKKHQGALVVGLTGDLGAGKTAFVKALAKHLGVAGTVGSPTFVILKRYPAKKNFKYLIHIDAYRLKSGREFRALGWRDITKDDTSIIFIEWPENVTSAMPKHARHIQISQIFREKDTHRELKLK